MARVISRLRDAQRRHNSLVVLGAIFLVAIVSGVAAAPQAADCGPTPYDCAVTLVQRQEFPAAIDTLTQILAQTPKNLKALNLLGIALTSAGRADEAAQRFTQALTIDPTFYPARKNLAINEFTRGHLAEAQRDFEQVLAHAPDDEITHLHLAEIQFQRKERRAALPHYEKAHSRLFQNPSWMLHYAACLLDQAQKVDQKDRESTTKAVAVLNQLPKDDAASLFDAGVLLGQAGAHAEAATFFGAARAGYKDPYAAGYNQTLMLIDAGDSAGAIRVAQELLAQTQAPRQEQGQAQAQRQGQARGLAQGQGQAQGMTQAVTQGVTRAELYSLLGQAYVKAERIKEAYDALREATRLEPKAVEHYVDLAMICIDHQNFDLGLEIVDIGLKYRPDSSLLYLQRGVLFAMKGSIEQAGNEFARASAVAPDDAVPYVAQAMTWMQTGQAAKAVEVLRARTRVNQKDAVIFYALGVALLRAGASPEDAGGAEAKDAFASAVRQNPEFPQARAELGKLLLKRGDTDEAITHLEKAIALDPENAAPAYVLAQAYRKRGEMDRARDLLARVSTINTRERGDDPDHELKRVIIRIVREGAAPPKGNGTQP
jgi:tetratricopeptide (TPR) repeat protein